MSRGQVVEGSVFLSSTGLGGPEAYGSQASSGASASWLIRSSEQLVAVAIDQPSILETGLAEDAAFPEADRLQDPHGAPIGGIDSCFDAHDIRLPEILLDSQLQVASLRIGYYRH